MYEAIPENVVECLGEIFADDILAITYSSVRACLADIVQKADDKFFLSFENALKIVAAMKKTIEFANNAHVKVS